jgi:hypothetical protein
VDKGKETETAWLLVSENIKISEKKLSHSGSGSADDVTCAIQREMLNAVRVRFTADGG